MAMVDSSSINNDVAKTRGNAPNLAKCDPTDDVGNNQKNVMDVSIMLQSMSVTVIKGALTVTSKKRMLIKVEKKVVVVNAAFNNVQNDKVEKTRTAEVEWKLNSISTNKEVVASSNNGTLGVPGQSAVPYDCFQIMLLGHYCKTMMV